MHTWIGIDFRGNFPENRSIFEKANYSTENSGNFRTKLKWNEKSGWDISENLGEPHRVVRLFSRKFWEMLFHTPLEISNQGRLPCDEKFWYKLSKSPALTDETWFQEISGKEDNLSRCSKIFENSFIYGWTFLFSEIQQFPYFLKTCPGNFHTICPLFKIFGIFVWKESAPEFLIKIESSPRFFVNNPTVYFMVVKPEKPQKIKA